jgi:putative peptide zinc metalloprotease protein
MDQTAPASELERRKALKIRLRADLNVEPAKYEGRTYFVVKDPVSLRYYRLKDNEHFLLQFLDGRRTLEDAQKEYEKRYRPDRLKLEDLEAFAQQLLTAGLAQSESPRAGKQLFERRTKRKRSEWMQTLTNILYIKIPVIDPDRILNAMLGYCGWIFSLWFFVLSVGVMLAAALLVATHFETFRGKLPNYHEFFSFKTVAYLWVALGCVKVIHEFGHGLSCKRFGGEVHEMGALFLCFSPALYCNVSDAWTLPSKWHRIIISAAGIYVELIIAAVATFVWWNTPTQPFVNNLALSLMVVCSVSTVVFNANPLMRYDGYYVLADWLEIPNLRERSNRFLKNLVLEHCLGVEVQPEGYMALWRRVLFVTYAITSYIYRWVVTFTILYFMDNFLKPYKLQVVSHALAFAAAASMAGWPLWRLGKNIHKRGRFPDMKRWRVVTSGAVLTAAVLFVCLVPVPVSRVRGVALVQPQPDAMDHVFVRQPGILKALYARPGAEVRKGEKLAEFINRDLDAELASAVTDREVANKEVDSLERQMRELNNDPTESGKLVIEIGKAKTRQQTAIGKVQGYENLKADLTLLSPRDGVVGQGPKVEDVGRFFEKDPNQTSPLFTIIEPGRLRVCLPVVTPEFNLLKEDMERPSAKAHASYQLLRKRVTVNYQGAPLPDVLRDLEGQVKGLKLALDPGLTNEQTVVTYKAEKERAGVVLDQVLGNRLGYVVVSEKGAERDGLVEVRPGHARGLPEGPRKLNELDVTIRVHGRGAHTWKGRVVVLPESDAKTIPLALSSRANGPVAVKAASGSSPNAPLVPQAQHYLLYVDIIDPDGAITPGSLAQVKIYCQPETCLRWLWRKANDAFDLGLI